MYASYQPEHLLETKIIRQSHFPTLLFLMSKRHSLMLSLDQTTEKSALSHVSEHGKILVKMWSDRANDVGGEWCRGEKKGGGIEELPSNYYI